MVAPLDKDKDKASGASKNRSVCPLELIQALLELLHAQLQQISAPLELLKALTMPFLLKNVKICQFCREMLKYNVFGPIILDYAPGEFFCWRFYAWRRGRILIVPDYYDGHHDDHHDDECSGELMTGSGTVSTQREANSGAR